MHLEIKIMEHFIGNPDACETATDVARHWLGGEDPVVVLSALQNMTNCGLLHRFGEGERAVFYCVDAALMQAVLHPIKERQLAHPLAKSDNTISIISLYPA